MKKSFHIFQRDLSRLLHTKAAILVLIGVCLLPSLYAWFNIAANLDPYGNTSKIKVAIACLDKEASSENLSINAGKEIVKNLKENKQLGWTFTSEKEALNGVKSGKYYASIVIPEDFSRSLISILSGDLQTPKLDYYINEKANAIAPKITGTGAAAIQEQINSTFSSVASESVSGILKQSASDLSSTLGSVNSDITKTLEKADANIAAYKQFLENFNAAAEKSAPLITRAKSTASSLKSAASSGSSALSESSRILSETRTAAGNFSSSLSSSLTQGEILLGQAHNIASAGLTDLETAARSVNGSIGNALDFANSTAVLNGNILKELGELASLIPGSDLDSAIAGLQAQNTNNQELILSLSAGNAGIQNAINTTASTREQLYTITSANIGSLHDLRAVLDKNVLPQLNKTLDAFSSLTGEMNGLLTTVPSSADQIDNLLDQMSAGLSNTVTALEGTKTALSNVQEHLGTIQTDLNALSGSDIYETLLSLEGIDKQSVSAFMSSPVKIETKSFYKIANYGSAMTPFYTNLAIWVGGIVLIAIFKLEVDKDSSMLRYSSASLYFGRWLLYITVGMVQGFIVCIGDVFLKGIECAHPAALIFTGVICSFVYVNIIYALSISFKHIGKALCVLLVILQIPGSSGTYPVEMTPAFFQNVHPFLPFTYGISAMRECIAGMYGSTYIHNLLILLLFVPVSLLIGLGIRPLLSGLNRLFDIKLAETDLMLGETPDRNIRRSAQLSLLLKASLSQEELQIQTAEKAQRFEKNYHKMIRFGFFAILTIPLIFLILMFSLESKIVFLILWILSIILIATWLITVEYIHNELAAQQELSGMSFEEMLKLFRKMEEN